MAMWELGDTMISRLKHECSGKSMEWVTVKRKMGVVAGSMAGEGSWEGVSHVATPCLTQSMKHNRRFSGSGVKCGLSLVA